MRANKEYRLRMTEEAREIVSRMSLEEKVNLMSANLDISIMTPEYVGEMMTNDKCITPQSEAVHYG